MRNKSVRPFSVRPELPEVSAEMIEFHVRRGRQLQAMAIGDALRRGWHVLGFGVSAAEPPSGELAENARNALAAIRSSAELLREDGIAPAERSRFAEIVLAEERRLGTLLAQLLDDGRRSAP